MGSSNRLAKVTVRMINANNPGGSSSARTWPLRQIENCPGPPLARRPRLRAPLQFHEAVVAAVWIGHEFVMAADIFDFAFFEEHDAIRLPNGR